jgi:hypothetical protein
MLTAQPSAYDMFALIELYGRKLQSEYGPFWEKMSIYGGIGRKPGGKLSLFNMRNS